MNPRKMLGNAMLLLALVTPDVMAQTQPRFIYSRPEIPSEAALARLNLRLAWRRVLPMDGGRDAILRADLNGNDLLVITRSGMVARLDAETGKLHWRARAGKPYTMLPYLAANSRSVYVISNATMFALDRATGAEKWDYPLPGGISAPPAVDEEQLYLPTATTRLYAFYLPFVQTEATEDGSPGSGLRSSPIYARSDPTERVRPRPVWVDQTNVELFYRPLLSEEELMIVSPSGEGIGFSKVPREGMSSTEIYNFNLDQRVAFPPTAFGDTAFIGCDDASLYAMNMQTGRLRWRHTAGTAISRAPVALETDVYVTSTKEGLARLDRKTGEALWKFPVGRINLDANFEADRFLAANAHFVYATDHSGRLLILDRKRGHKLSMLDTSAYRVPVVNDVTDRLYLAANDGLILCLHDRNQVQPIRHRRILEELASPVLKRLNQNIIDPGSKEVTLREALAEMRKKYGVHFVVASRVFKEAKLPDPQDRRVTLPRTENKPLKDHLRRTLDQVDATYQVVDKSVLIIPAPPRKKE